MLEKLSPIVHQYNWDLYRVPLRKVGNKYTIYVGDNFTREFDEQTLPDEIKTKMDMILSRPQQILQDRELTSLMLMTTLKDEELIEIGWQASDSYFVIVLPYSSLMKLRGEE
jgi:hypothetical protein